MRNQPNILLIVADDLGWSDLGAFGGDIDSPCLDRLASQGTLLTNFHASPVCSTTRAMLMTGCDHHEVGLGNLVELMQPAQKGKPGYEGVLNDRAPTLAERLRDAGYLTLLSGKWHLGVCGESPPWKKGFEKSYAFFQGEHNHYGYDQTPETAGIYGTSHYALDGVYESYPLGEYSTDRFAAKMSEFIEQAADDPRPVFAYLAFTAPHCPLQAPAPLVAKYRGRYDAGPDAMRERRLARMKALGLSVAGATPSEIWGEGNWDTLSDDQRRLESRKMEVFAAMVDAMDSAVARVLRTLEKTGRRDDTLIMFMSDNGPAGTLREESPGSREWILRNADNRLENIGNATSYVSIGPRWAQAQAAPFFLFKRYTTEGGVRTCAFVTGPGVPAARECTAFIHVMDVAPTFAALAGASADSPPGKLPMRGRSALPVLLGRETDVHGPDHAICWELGFGRAVKIGSWKAVYLPVAARNTISGDLSIDQWLLFNIDTDPGETRDLADREPAVLAKLVAAWNRYAEDTGVVFNSP